MNFFRHSWVASPVASCVRNRKWINIGHYEISLQESWLFYAGTSLLSIHSHSRLTSQSALHFSNYHSSLTNVQTRVVNILCSIIKTDGCPLTSLYGVLTTFAEFGADVCNSRCCDCVSEVFNFLVFCVGHQIDVTSTGAPHRWANPADRGWIRIRLSWRQAIGRPHTTNTGGKWG